MAFPNSLFPGLSFEPEVSDDEFRLFHSIDRRLMTTLTDSLNRNPLDAINVVAFLLWLEKDRLGRNTVYKVVQEWPDYLINILADEVVALLGWLRNPTLVWGMRGDISLIQKLCNKDVGFISLHERRLEIFQGKKKIINEICVRAFKDMFPAETFLNMSHDVIEDDEFGIIGGAPVNDPREEIQNRNESGVGSVLDPRELINRVTGGVGIGGAPVYDPREEIQNRNDMNGVNGSVRDPRELINGVVHAGAREVENTNGVGLAAGPVDDPQRPQYNNHHGVGPVYDPRVFMNRNRNRVEIASAASRFVQGNQQLMQNNNVGGLFAARPLYNPPVLRNFNHNGAGFEVGGRVVHDPRELKNLNRYGGVGFGAGASGLVHGPDDQEVENKIVGFAAGGSGLVHGPDQEVENTNVGNFVAGPSHINTHQQIKYDIHNRLLGIHNGGGFIHDPRQVNIMNHHNGQNMNGIARGFIHGNPETAVQIRNEIEYGGGYGNEPFQHNGEILPDVAFGPRRGYVETNARNLRNAQGSEMENTRNPISQDELSVLLSGLNVGKEEDEVTDDDKTVFLTFSKGYPVTEPELWGYFTRKFGNFIKAIHFQEMPEGEQPLYARMVARNPSILPLICDVIIRTKYVINGKHVWAKRYVRKNTPTPPRSSSSSAPN